MSHPPKDALAGSQQELAASKAALEKDKALFAYSRITAPFDGVITQIDAYTGALLPAGTSSNQGDQTLCHLVAKQSSAPGDSRARESSCQTSTSVKPSPYMFLRLTKSFHGQSQLHSPIKLMSRRARCTRKSMSRTRSTKSSPECTRRSRFRFTSVENVLTVPVQAVQASSEEHGSVLVVGSDNRDRQTRCKHSASRAPRISKSSPGCTIANVVVFGEQSQYKPGRTGQPQGRHTLGSGIGIRHVVIFNSPPLFHRRDLSLCLRAGPHGLVQMPVDMFPPINIPVVDGGDVLQRNAAAADRGRYYRHIRAILHARQRDRPHGVAFACLA